VSEQAGKQKDEGRTEIGKASESQAGTLTGGFLELITDGLEPKESAATRQAERISESTQAAESVTRDECQNKQQVFRILRIGHGQKSAAS
jgi:hypothetical protein